MMGVRTGSQSLDSWGSEDGSLDGALSDRRKVEVKLGRGQVA